MAPIRLTAIYLFLCGILAAESFAGIAVNSVNGQPLAGVHLKLFTLSIGVGMTDAYGAISASDGRFSMGSIPPGSYVLLTERTGFVQMMTPSGAIPLPTVAIKSGERVTDYKLEMTPRAVINVRVVDDYGDPVSNVSIAAKVAPGSPVAADLAGNQGYSTNVLGEARISGGPGKFLIKATPNAYGLQLPEVRSDGTSEATFGPTWYPSALSEAAATPFEVAAGARASVEIRLVRQRSLTISGTVSGAPQDAAGSVMLATFDRPGGRRINSRSTSVGAGGKFTFTKLPPAHYRVTALVYSNRSPMQSQPVEFTPDSPDALDVQLVLAPGAEISGSLRIAGDPPGAPAEKRTITLQPIDNSSMSSGTGTTESDGVFRIPDIFPGRYRIEVKPLPDNGYVQTVELNGAASSSLDLDLSRGAQGSRMRITLARDAAQLSGTVLDKDGQPLGASPAIVLLTADRNHIVPNQDGMVREGGKYSFKNIRPGKYWLFAIDAFRSGPASSEEDFKRIAAAAEEIEIKPDEKIAKDLKVLLKEDVDARNKK